MAQIRVEESRETLLMTTKPTLDFSSSRILSFVRSSIKISSPDFSPGFGLYLPRIELMSLRISSREIFFRFAMT